MRRLVRLRERLLSGEAIVAGVLSGTSADGIDVGLVRFERSRDGERLGAAKLIAFETVEFERELERRVRAVLDGEVFGLRESALLSRDLGRAFGGAVRDLAARAALEVELVGSHGQTVYHHDGLEPSGAASLQLGDGDFVCEAARATTVSDFRQRDLARGGEGAPISALADDLIFHRAPKPCAILNLGGMANLTILADDRAPLAFDTGPANALLDGLARRLFERPFDEGGELAKTGCSSRRLVDALLAHPFFAKLPPKSTGRDTFGAAYVGEVLATARDVGANDPRDVLASAVELVARSVADALEHFASDRPHWLILAGGGIHNRALVDALAARCPQPVASAEDFGVDPDAREALVFAVLAARSILGEGAASSRATGARDGAPLGKISPWVGA